MRCSMYRETRVFNNYLFNVMFICFCAVSKYHVLCKQALSLCGATPHSNSQKGLSTTAHYTSRLPTTRFYRLIPSLKLKRPELIGFCTVQSPRLTTHPQDAPARVWSPGCTAWLACSTASCTTWLFGGASPHSLKYLSDMSLVQARRVALSLMLRHSTSRPCP